MLRKSGGKGRVRAGGPLMPTPERFAHGDVVRLARAILDTKNELARPYAGLGTLERMERAGTINARERYAGNKFHNLFRRAMLDHLRAADPTRIPVILSNGNAHHIPEGDQGARLAVFSALDAMGGVQSLAGSCAWHVLGCEATIVGWSLAISSTGRRINKHAASGILIADLQHLRAHFGC
jgi:hypothetical protein